MEPADARRQLGQMITGYWVSQLVYLAAKLDLAELVAKAPQTAEQLASATGTHADSLYRALRALASVGVFAEDAVGQFSNTPLSELLRSGVTGSQRAMAIMMGEEHFACWGDLLGSITTGQTAFDRIYRRPIFEYLSQNPEQAAVFDAAMVSIHGHETAAIAENYDFSPFKRIADVGGGNGSLLCGVLQRYPALEGILFDLPHVLDRANQTIEAAGLTERIHVVAGDFFKSVPISADVCMLRHIIHDWDHDRSVRILENVHRALPAGGRVLVIESVIAPGNEPSFGKLLDINMLLIPGGRERTEAEYRDLFRRAGFRLSRIVPTGQDLSVIEGLKDRSAHD